MPISKEEFISSRESPDRLVSPECDVGNGCHAVPRVAVWRDVCANEVGKLLIGKGSDSYFVYFASLRSE